jgi:hypothetical protein
MRVKSALRYELKYLITQRQAAALIDLMRARMVPDAYGGDEGSYAIASLYFDTPDYKAYWDKLEGHEVRRKVRVRAYGRKPVTASEPVYLEIKQRVNKLMAKRRVSLPYADAVNPQGVDADGAPNLAGDARAVLQEVQYLQEMLYLRPACIVRYDRLAFEGGEHFPDLRVTFDSNLRGQVRDLALTTGPESERRILSPERLILEVKVNRTVPFWLSQALSREGCVLQRISKYCATLETNAVINARQRLSGSWSPKPMPR